MVGFVWIAGVFYWEGFEIKIIEWTVDVVALVDFVDMDKVDNAMNRHFVHVHEVDALV